VSHHYKNPTQRVCSYSAGSLKQQSTGRYDDGRFVLDKHAELDSYSSSSLKQRPQVDMMLVVLY
jgi:hypothetical protein